MKNILVAMPFDDTHKAYIEKIGTDCEFRYTTIKTATAEEVKAADIIFGNISPELVKQNDHLEWMQLNSAGSDQYCKPGVIGPDTILTCATGAYGLSVSEHMVSMSMMLCRKMDLYMKNQINHEWKEEGSVTSIWNSTTLVAGLGDIGSEYAKRMKAVMSLVFDAMWQTSRISSTNSTPWTSWMRFYRRWISLYLFCRVPRRPITSWMSAVCA